MKKETDGEAGTCLVFQMRFIFKQTRLIRFGRDRHGH